MKEKTKAKIIMPGSHLFDANATLNMHILKQWKLNRSDASNDARFQKVLISCIAACVDPIQFPLF